MICAFGNSGEKKTLTFTRKKVRSGKVVPESYLYIPRAHIRRGKRDEKRGNLRKNPILEREIAPDLLPRNKPVHIIVIYKSKMEEEMFYKKKQKRG